MNLFAYRKQFDRLFKPLVELNTRIIPISANAWTLVGTLVGIACGVCFYVDQWFMGLVLLPLRGYVDVLDGYVARSRNQSTAFGAVMDDVSDRYILGIIYAGGCLNLAQQYPHLLWVCALGLTGALNNVIIKLSIYAETRDANRETGKLGHPVDLVGMFGSTEFMIYFGFPLGFMWLFNEPRLGVLACWLVAVLSHVSMLQRVVFSWRNYRRPRQAEANAASPAQPAATAP